MLQPALVVEFRILGPLEVVDDDRAVMLGGQKQRALLGLLLVRAGQVVSTDKLVEGLWGEEPPKAAKNSLQNLVVQLRKLLGQDALVTRPPGYVLQVESGQTVGYERAIREVYGLGGWNELDRGWRRASSPKYLVQFARHNVDSVKPAIQLTATSPATSK